MLCCWITYKLVGRYKMIQPPKITSLVLTSGSYQVISVKTAPLKPGDTTTEDFYYTDAKYLNKYVGPFKSVYEATKDYTDNVKHFKAAFGGTPIVATPATTIDFGVKPLDNLIVCDFKTKKYYKPSAV